LRGHFKAEERDGKRGGRGNDIKKKGTGETGKHPLPPPK